MVITKAKILIVKNQGTQLGAMAHTRHFSYRSGKRKEGREGNKGGRE
jgi:hypothetical protein